MADQTDWTEPVGLNARPALWTMLSPAIADAAGAAWGAFWSSTALGQPIRRLLPAANLVFGTLGDKVPQEFIDDRGRLRGAKFDIEAMKAAIPQKRDQFRAHVGWLESQLSDSRDWLLGAFSLADVNAYMNVWYVRARLSSADELLVMFPHVLAWERRIQSVGHGPRSEMSSHEALDIATRASPQTPICADADDPNGRQPGDSVTVAPDDYGKVAAPGEIVSLSAQHIAIRRHDDRAGEIVVHFPRAGFAVTRGEIGQAQVG